MPEQLIKSCLLGWRPVDPASLFSTLIWSYCWPWEGNGIELVRRDSFPALTGYIYDYPRRRILFQYITDFLGYGHAHCYRLVSVVVVSSYFTHIHMYCACTLRSVFNIWTRLLLLLQWRSHRDLDYCRALSMVGIQEPWVVSWSTLTFLIAGASDAVAEGRENRQSAMKM